MNKKKNKKGKNKASKKSFKSSGLYKSKSRLKSSLKQSQMKSSEEGWQIPNNDDEIEYKAMKQSVLEGQTVESKPSTMKSERKLVTPLHNDNAKIMIIEEHDLRSGQPNKLGFRGEFRNRASQDRLGNKKIDRTNISEHFVGKMNEENIEDFLNYKVRPRAGNLTIGLKKLIFLAKVFLEEPDFIILEENALDFDELDNKFFFDVLRVRFTDNLQSLILC